MTTCPVTSPYPMRHNQGRRAPINAPGYVPRILKRYFHNYCDNEEGIAMRTIREAAVLPGPCTNTILVLWREETADVLECTDHPIAIHIKEIHRSVLEK